MGNTSSGVTSAVKQQVEGSSCAMYRWVNMAGGGELVQIAKKIRLQRTDDYMELDNKILEVIPSFLYNGGQGKAVSIASMINQRHKERTGLDIQKPKTVTHQSRSGGGLWKWIHQNSVRKYRGVLGRFGDATAPTRRDTPSPQCPQFGETALHMAIVNEDPMYVRMLLDYDVDVHQRCCGNFFTPDDQKSSRHDVWDHEWVHLAINTNYKGHMYWGEYPLSFAACLEQEISFRLVAAKGADPNRQDTNGNTVMHIVVIHRKTKMIDLCLNAGSKLHIKNCQGLTPLTLAAKLAHNEMYQLLLVKEREIVWEYGHVLCAGYPLQHMDSIEPGTGNINKNAVLPLAVYGVTSPVKESEDHLKLLDGVLEELLRKKWKGFAKRRFFMQLYQFVIYLAATMVAMILRPTHLTMTAALDEQADNDTAQFNSTFHTCYLWRHDTATHIVRNCCEICTVLGSVWFLLQTCIQIRYVGHRLYMQSLAEDVVCIIAALLISCQFLFFCRGFKLSGPFVLMIYKIIAKDLVRFLLIYSIFVAGFAQAFYIIFIGYKRGPDYADDFDARNDKTILPNVFESFVRMFIFSLNEFAVLYEELQFCNLASVGKVLFMVYGLIISILLINMLIAMMGNTYLLIAESKKEWIRQWAAIILMLEQGIAPSSRLQLQKAYSLPIQGDIKQRALMIRWKIIDEEKRNKQILRLKKRKQFAEEGKKLNSHPNMLDTPRTEDVHKEQLGNAAA